MWGMNQDPRLMGIETHGNEALLQSPGRSDKTYKIRINSITLVCAVIVWLIFAGVTSFSVYSTVVVMSPSEAVNVADEPYYAEKVWCIFGPETSEINDAFSCLDVDEYIFSSEVSYDEYGDVCSKWGSPDDKDEYYGVCSTNLTLTSDWCQRLSETIIPSGRACRKTQAMFVVPSNFTEKGAYFLSTPTPAPASAFIWTYTIALDIWTVLLLGIVLAHPTSIKRQGQAFQVQRCCGCNTVLVPFTALRMIYTINSYQWCGHAYFFKYLHMGCWGGEPQPGMPSVVLLGGCAHAYRFSLDPQDYQEFVRDNIVNTNVAQPVHAQLVTASVLPMSNVAQTTAAPHTIVKVES